MYLVSKIIRPHTCVLYVCRSSLLFNRWRLTEYRLRSTFCVDHRLKLYKKITQKLPNNCRTASQVLFIGFFHRLLRLKYIYVPFRLAHSYNKSKRTSHKHHKSAAPIPHSHSHTPNGRILHQRQAETPVCCSRSRRDTQLFFFCYIAIYPYASHQVWWINW